MIGVDPGVIEYQLAVGVTLDVTGHRGDQAPLNLGFNPGLQKGDEIVEEHQFLNVGIAVHPNEILDLCDEKDVRVKRG